MTKKAIIIGAGPAGLTAAYELLKRTDITPIILEKSGDIGGISKTVNYKGNRIDIGGHRFFSKSDRVMEWWMKIMPLEQLNGSIRINYQNKVRNIKSAPCEVPLEDPDKVMLVRRRLSRIYFLRKFFSYPISLSIDTLKKLGLLRALRIVFSYTYARLFPRKPEKSLEDFFHNRFGNELYRLFFKDYTEKVWGVPCKQISAEWGAQRIKGISFGKVLAHALRSIQTRSASGKDDIGQKQTETSLIEKFLYPKFGPGQLWEEVARQVREMGGEIHLYQNVKQIHTTGFAVTSIEALNMNTGEARVYNGDYFFSTMPVQELIAAMDAAVPPEVRAIAEGLQYRDFITVGVLLSKLATQKMLPDTWIYIQERDVKVGRLQIFNNWSPFMVKDPNTVWVGMEYFCNKTDDFWDLTDIELRAGAIKELEKMGLARSIDVLDSTVLRMEKTYPAYFGTYDRFGEIRKYTDAFANLVLIGRNGMHKYNNSDHSMLTAMVAVDNILAGATSKDNIWAVNSEQEYHEDKTIASPQVALSRDPHPKDLWGWIWNNPANRVWWALGFAAVIVQFILFKHRYPFANYMPDSYSYLDAAVTNVDVNMWPVAYSKFLRLISVFTHSDKIVVAIQYFFMQLSAFTFLFSLLHLLKPDKIVRNILIVFFIFDPATLYMSNYISADSLFIGFSFLWLSSLLWIIFRPRPWLIVVHAFLLLACFTIRYNAICYPFIAMLGFLLSGYRWYWRLSGIALSAVVILASFLFTSAKMKEVTGHRQFSAFGGWQLANNALYMYQDVPAKDRQPVPARFAKLEAMVRQHIDTLQRVKLTKEDSVACRFYLWSPKGPLIQYMLRETSKDSTSVTPYFRRWASVAPLYMDYGSYLIRKYPQIFVNSVLLPNLRRYAAPPVEFLGVYNMGSDSVGLLVKTWFNYKSQKVKDHNKKNAHILPMAWYSIFAALANAVFLISLIGMLLFKGFRSGMSVLSKVIYLVLFTWLVNVGFSILASPIVLRYQLFPVLISFTIAMVLLNAIYHLAIEEELKKKMQIA